MPNDPDATVTLTDNNIDRTSLLEFEEGVDKNNNRIVNYVYRLSEIAAAHNLVVTCASAGAKIYIKINGVWTEYSKIWVKENGTWVEQSIINWSNIFDTRANYRKMN